MEHTKKMLRWKLKSDAQCISIVSECNKEFIMGCFKSNPKFDEIKAKFERIIIENNESLELMVIKPNLFSA